VYLNILIVTQYFYPEQFRINDLPKELLLRGHKVTVLTGIPNYPLGEWFDGYGLNSVGCSDWEGARIVRVPTLPRFSGKGWQLAMNYISFVLTGCLMAPYYCRDEYDLIFTYEPSPFTVGIPAVMFRWLRGIPMIFWVQDLWPESLAAAGKVRSRTALRIVGGIVRWVYKRCDMVLVQSKAFIEPAISAGANAQQTRYFPNWAENSFTPVKPPIDRQIPPGFVVMFAGNLGEAQSLPTIVRAAEQTRDVPEIQWVIIGVGRRLRWMQQEINRLGLNNNVHFLLHHPTESMPAFFAQADALLVTLKQDPIFSLTIPSKVQSYMACGKPILGGLDGEGARIIEEANAGYTSPAEDSAALAAAVLRLYRTDIGERQAMGMRARDYFERNFERDRLIDKLEVWMTGLVEDSPC